MLFRSHVRGPAGQRPALCACPGGDVRHPDLLDRRGPGPGGHDRAPLPVGLTSAHRPLAPTSHPPAPPHHPPAATAHPPSPPPPLTRLNTLSPFELASALVVMRQ